MDPNGFLHRLDKPLCLESELIILDNNSLIRYQLSLLNRKMIFQKVIGSILRVPKYGNSLPRFPKALFLCWLLLKGFSVILHHHCLIRLNESATHFFCCDFHLLPSTLAQTLDIKGKVTPGLLPVYESFSSLRVDWKVLSGKVERLSCLRHVLSLFDHLSFNRQLRYRWLTRGGLTFV